MALPDRFWQKVNKMALGGHWLWIAGKDGKGRGAFKMDGKQHQSHKLAFLDAGGVLTADKPNVLHRCIDTPACVNPDHLYAGSQMDNTLDCVASGRHNNASKTHCARGHEFTHENTYHYEKKNGGIQRMCKTCKSANIRAAQDKNKKSGLCVSGCGKPLVTKMHCDEHRQIYNNTMKEFNGRRVTELNNLREQVKKLQAENNQLYKELH